MTVWQISVIILHVIVAPLATVHALLYKRDSRSALGWISVCVLFPVFGPFWYYLFGINRVRTRASSLNKNKLRRRIFGYERGENFISDSVPDSSRLIPPQYLKLGHLSDSITGAELLPGNTVELLENGEGAYPRMLESIRSAKRTVYLMTYILETNRTGRKFIDALGNAVKSGVDVRVIVDGLGEMYSYPWASHLLKMKGVRVVRFLPPSLFPPSLYINLRNHRKLLIVDDAIAYAGGMNIGDRHLVDDPGNSKPTQDIHFEFTGPIINQLYRTFANTWTFITRQEIPEPETIQESTGDATCRVIIDGPDENLDQLELVMIGAITSAVKSVCIMTPYFLPSREMISALKTTALKGVLIQIVLPQKSNLPYVHWASNNMLGELLQYNIQVLRQPPPFAHTKLFIIDDLYALVGSANIDPRSLRLNFEIGIEIYHDASVKSLKEFFQKALDKSVPYNSSDLDNRSLPVRLRDAFFWLFSPYL